MKPTRLFLVTLLGLGLALSTTPVFACDHGSGGSNEGSSWSFFGWCQHFFDSDSHHRECDQNGQNSGRGNNCDHGRGNGGGYCGTGGSSSGGSSGGSTSGGSGSTSGTGNPYK
jgi:hypothetical protein